MSDKIILLGQELGLTAKQWEDFYNFMTLYFDDYHGDFLLNWDNIVYKENSEQLNQCKIELLERKFLEWVEIMEIRKYNRIIGI